MQSSIQCLACGECFWSLEEYDHHRHAAGQDLGTAFHSSGRTRLTSLISDDECPEPPRLDG